MFRISLADTFQLDEGFDLFFIFLLKLSKILRHKRHSCYKERLCFSDVLFRSDYVLSHEECQLFLWHHERGFYLVR